MDNVTEFIRVFLHLVAEFLGTEPISYIFVIVLLIAIVGVLRRLLSP